MLRQRFVGRPRWTAEHLMELRAGHGQARAVIEVGLVEPEGAVRLQVDQVVENPVDISWLAVGGQPHQLVFAGIDLEAGVIGKRRIQQTERMREVDFLEDFQRLATPDGQRGGSPFADAVHGQYRSLLEGRRKKRAGGVAQVVLGEAQPAVPVGVRGMAPQFLDQQILEEELFAQPDRNRHAEGLEAPRREAHIGFQQALELEEGLVVEGYMIDILQADAGFVQAIFQRIVGETGIVLLAREAFLLRGGDDLAVTQQGGSAVVIEGGNAEDMHAARSKESVDEGRHRASL